MTATSSRHLLVVVAANVEGSALAGAVRDLAAAGPADVLVLAPALNSRLRHWMSDSDGAHRAAEARLAHCVERLRQAGVSATGAVGDADPMLAIEDAMSLRVADEIVIATDPDARSNWLARDLVGRACLRFNVPVAHIVDHAAHQAPLAA